MSCDATETPKALRCWRTRAEGSDQFSQEQFTRNRGNAMLRSRSRTPSFGASRQLARCASVRAIAAVRDARRRSRTGDALTGRGLASALDSRSTGVSAAEYSQVAVFAGEMTKAIATTSMRSACWSHLWFERMGRL